MLHGQANRAYPHPRASFDPVPQHAGPQGQSGPFNSSPASRPRPHLSLSLRRCMASRRNGEHVRMCSAPRSETSNPAEVIIMCSSQPPHHPSTSATPHAGSQDPRTHPCTKLLMAALPSIAASCEQALARAGTAQSQSLFEAYARLQQLRGLPVAIPAGTAATSEQTSKVCGG